mmetsp:Transcript_72910/g.160982  ORF Transcript_72910/g.160982 Transcript_72910/m.160982 type:complete len:251 (+) Transcript_72910:724-1476(+)
MTGKKEDPKCRHHTSVWKDSFRIEAGTKHHVEHVLWLIPKCARFHLLASLLNPCIHGTFQHFVHVVDGFPEPQISRERESLQDWEGQVEGVQHLCHHDLVMPISVVKLAINGAKALSKHCGAQHIQGVPRHVSFGINLLATSPGIQQLVGCLIEFGHQVSQRLLLEGRVHWLAKGLPLSAIRHHDGCILSVLGVVQTCLDALRGDCIIVSLGKVLWTRQDLSGKFWVCDGQRSSGPHEHLEHAWILMTEF